MSRYPIVLTGLLVVAIFAWKERRATPAALQASGSQPSGYGPPPDLYTYKIIRTYSHDRSAFTQGLLFDQQGDLLESTGMYGRTEVRRVALETGAVITSTRGEDHAFGEGLAEWNGYLLQLDWKQSRGVVYNATTLKRIGTFTHPYKDGWGLTNSPTGDHLVMTDSEHSLFTVAVEVLPNGHDLRLTETVRVAVHDQGRVVTMVNELERVGDQIYANIFGKDCLAIIQEDGRVAAWVNLMGILQEAVRDRLTNAVLNGIAYNPLKKNRIFVTGKEWPLLFEIELVKSDISLTRARQVCIPTRNMFSGLIPGMLDGHSSD